MAVNTVRDLKVPYALDADGRVVAPLAAVKGAFYTCLECSQRLDLRRSRRERPHFAHRPDALRTCSGESATHLAAKHLLCAQLEEELAQHAQIVWHLPCTGAGAHPCRDHATLKQTATLAAWDAVALEVAHGPYRFDVAITHQGQVIYGFEVFFRHQVPQAKAANLAVPWLELVAEDILRYRPRIPWQPDGRSQQVVQCPSCQELHRQLQKRVVSEQQRSYVQAEFVAETERVKRAWLTILGYAKTL